MYKDSIVWKFFGVNSKIACERLIEQLQKQQGLMTIAFL